MAYIVVKKILGYELCILEKEGTLLESPIEAPTLSRTISSSGTSSGTATAAVSLKTWSGLHCKCCHKNTSLRGRGYFQFKKAKFAFGLKASLPLMNIIAQNAGVFSCYYS